MKRLFLVLAVILCVLSACNTDRDRLIEINGYLNENRLDSAQHFLSMVSPYDLKPYDKALYNLITVKLNHLSYEPVPSDTLIRYCVNTFTRYGDKERLAESLYYQAVTEYEDQHVPQAFTTMKKAEDVAQDIDDLNIRHKIFESLTDWNMSEHQYELAMTYGKRNLALATLANNNNWIAYALVFISQIHNGLGQRDSARLYLDKCVNYMKDVPDSQRVDFYNYIAAATINTDLPTAYTYAMKGNAIRPNSVGYVTLAQIRCREGADNAVVDSLCNKAYDLASNFGECKFVFRQMMYIYESQKRYDKANLASKAFMDVWDNEARLREKHDVRNVQAAYDYKMKELRIKQNTTIAIIVAIILVFALVILFLYFHYCKHLHAKENSQSKQLVDNYQQMIKELETKHKDDGKQIKKLNNRIAHLKEEQPKILYEGRKLYDQIMNGGTTLHWEDDDFNNFFEYYSLIDMPFITHLENNYSNLSNSNKMFLILFHMGLDDLVVATIMVVAEDSLRMVKSRLRKIVNDESGALGF